MKYRKFVVVALAFVALMALVQLGAAAQPANLQQNQANQCGLLPKGLAQQISSTEPWYCPINQEIYTQWSGYLPIASLAVTIGFLVGSIIFMFGVGLKNDRIRNFGVGEIYEAMASGIVVGAFVYISAVMFGILPGSLVGAINPFATSFYQIQQTITAAQSTFTSIFNLYMPLQFLLTIKQSVAIVGSYAVPVNLASNLLYLATEYGQFPIIIFLIDPANVIGAFLADGIVLLYSEYYIMVFLASAAIPAFLAPGVVFRAIAPTRSLGGMMISLALAFFIVIPSLFAIVYYFTGPTLQQQLNAAAAGAAKFSANGVNAQLASLSPSSPLVVQLAKVQQAMSAFWLQILFYPSLILAMTYAFITQASQFLGSSTKAMGGKIRGFV